MTKEEFINAIQNDTRITELQNDKSYIFQVEVGNMPVEMVKDYLKGLKVLIDNVGVSKCVFVPISKGLGVINFYKIDDDGNIVSIWKKHLK